MIHDDDDTRRKSRQKAFVCKIVSILLTLQNFIFSAELMSYYDYSIVLTQLPHKINQLSKHLAIDLMINNCLNNNCSSMKYGVYM